MAFEYLDHGSDIGFKVRGSSLESVYVEGARALFQLIVEDFSDYSGSCIQTLTVKGEDLEELYYEWLAELLSLSDLQSQLFTEFNVTRLYQTDQGYYELKADITGLDLDPDMQDIRTEVKAITYQGLEVHQLEEGWEAQCIVDV